MYVVPVDGGGLGIADIKGVPAPVYAVIWALAQDKPQIAVGNPAEEEVTVEVQLAGGAGGGVEVPEAKVTHLVGKIPCKTFPAPQSILGVLVK